MGRNDSLLLRKLDFTESQVYYRVSVADPDELGRTRRQNNSHYYGQYLQTYFLGHPIDGAMVHCISITKNIEYSLYLARARERESSKLLLKIMSATYVYRRMNNDS